MNVGNVVAIVSINSALYQFKELYMKQRQMNEMLIFFAEIGRLDTVIALIARGADPKVNQYAPQRFAYLNGHSDVLEYLKQFNASRNN